MHSITLNQNWKKVRVTLDPPQKGPSRKGNEPTVFSVPGPGPGTVHHSITVLLYIILIHSSVKTTEMGVKYLEGIYI